MDPMGKFMRVKTQNGPKKMWIIWSSPKKWEPSLVTLWASHWPLKSEVAWKQLMEEAGGAEWPVALVQSVANIPTYYFISCRLEFPTFAARFISDFTIFRCFWSFFSHNQSLITSHSSAVCGYHAPKKNHRWATNEETLRELAGFITIGIRKGRHVQGIGNVENKGPNHARSGQALGRQEMSDWCLRIFLEVINLKQPAQLVGGIPTPLKNMSSSVGIIIPNIWKNKNVPNHQPEMIWS